MSVKTLQNRFLHRIITHAPGTASTVFVGPYYAKLYHGAVCIFSVDDPSFCKKIFLHDTTPAEKWTAYVDLSRREIMVEGVCRGRFFRYLLSAQEDGIYFIPLKNILSITIDDTVVDLQIKKKYLIIAARGSVVQNTGRLMLGCNKTPLLERIRKDPSLDEILPLLYHMAHPKPYVPSADCFLGRIFEQIQKKERFLLEDSFRTLWNVYTEGYAVLKKFDDSFSGQDLPVFSEALSSALTCIPYLIQSLFIREEDAKIFLLPCLLKPFASGRLIDVPFGKGHKISFEWSRHSVRRILIEAACDDLLYIDAKEISCRVTQIKSASRKKEQLFSEGIAVKEKKLYVVDRLTS